MSNLRYIIWNDEFSVGLEKLDDQHKKIFNAINELYDALQEEQRTSVASKILSDLNEYTKTHFGEEEHFMRECDYPDYESHKKIHDELMQKTKDMTQRFHSNYEELPLEIFEYLKSWWKNHILIMDKKYVPFIA